MNVLLGVSGGIAAYKAPDLVRRLRDAGHDVRTILTTNATRFVSPLSIAAVSAHGVITDQWGDPSHGGVDHVELARWADVLLIAPATANTIAKLATGIADDALSTYAVAHRGRVIVAPAMNSFMLDHVTVRHNLRILEDRGIEVIEPDTGLLACGDEGRGRLPDPEVIIARLQSRVVVGRDLEGVRILVTAGPTREAIDPVRYMTNRSSGRMGYALAESASRRGASVILVSGPVEIAPPVDVRVERVTSASEMRDAVIALAPEQDVVIMAAAVADFTPEVVSGSKIKKDSHERFSIDFVKAPDIVSELAALKSRPGVVVAFAAETDDLENNARSKLAAKGVDLVVGNDVSRKDIGFDSPDNEVVIVGRDGDLIRLGKASKREIAHAILDQTRALLNQRQTTRREEHTIG